MIKNIKHVFAFILMGFFTLAGFASEDKERGHPVVIKIIPQTKEFIQAWNPSEPPPFTDVGFESDLRYLDEYGYKIFFAYEVNAIPGFRSTTSQKDAPQKTNSDYLILKELADYRRAHLNNSNPMIVRLKVYDEEEKCFPVTLGLFVSGENNYQLTKKGDSEPLGVGDFLCSGSFKLDYKLIGYLKNNLIEAQNSTKDFKPIFAAREKLTTEADKVFEEYRKKREFQELEASIKQTIRERVEDQTLKGLQTYKSPLGIIYVVPSLQNNFPHTLPSLYALNTWITEHYMTVVERIFDVNLRRGSRTTPPFTATPPVSSEFNTFFFHVVKNLHLEKFCLNLFGKNLFDGNGQDGCFQSAFSYYFTDSEQAFLRWLDKYQTARLDSSPLLKKEPTKTITRIDVEFVSYLDMCPACRGSISYLSTKVETDQTLPWLQRRIVNYLQHEMEKSNIDIEKNNIRQMKFAKNILFNIFCISLAKCNKGATT